jgi:hypothetical protein
MTTVRGKHGPHAGVPARRRRPRACDPLVPARRGGFGFGLAVVWCLGGGVAGGYPGVARRSGGFCCLEGQRVAIHGCVLLNWDKHMIFAAWDKKEIRSAD